MAAMTLKRIKPTLTLLCMLGLLRSFDSQLIVRDTTPTLQAGSTPASSNLASTPPLVSSLPRRPPSPGFHTLLNLFPRNWDCSDCVVSLDLFREPYTPSAQAWCVYNCPFEDYWPELTKVGRNEQFLLVVNQWIQVEISHTVVKHHVLCNAWDTYAPTIVPHEAMFSCPPACTGLQTWKSAVSMQEKACWLMRGHISITPIQAAAIPFAMKSGETKQMFSVNDWRLPDDETGVCGRCNAGACIQATTLKLNTGGAVFATADIPNMQKVLVFGWQEFTTVYSEKQLKQAWKNWNSDDPLYGRITRQSRIASNNVKCTQGVTPACLQNKAAVTGRACLFQGVCFSRKDIFGQAYTHANTQAAFVVRGRAHMKINWFIGDDCTMPVSDISLDHVYSFDLFRHSFKLHVPLQCTACSNEQITSNFDPDTGARACEEPFSPFVLELSLTSHTGCSDSFVLYKQVECDLHHVSVRSNDQARLRCAACASLRAEDGFARGSHRPFIASQSQCQECLALERLRRPATPRTNAGNLASRVGNANAASIACGRCDDCRNCSKSSTFDAFEVTFCRPLDDMLVVQHADWQPTRRLAGRDQFKRTEYVPTALDPDHFRDAEFQQQACRCNNRHKYAQFCGEYALRDQDAWMTRSAGEEVRLSSFTDATELAGYSILRAGVCQPCLACPVRHFNGACEKGREGNCALCRILASCTATRNPYLHHSHAEGCEQTIALSDYECRECPVWAKIGQDHMLLIGCGDQNLRRWRPTASAFDGVLDVGECRFDHGDAPATPMCRHAGVALERKRPFGNYSALMPYCPPGWFFKCAGRPSTAPWDPECCAKCDVCPPEKSKNTATWRACSGASDVDTQSTNCVDRCENNMYEVNNTCLYCTTCKEGEL